MALSFNMDQLLWSHSSTSDNSSPSSAVFFDADNDGDQDLYIGVEKAAGSQGSQLWKNDGAGNFSLSQTFSADRVVKAWTVDIDGDGDKDLITRAYDAPIRIFTNNGSGSFTQTSTPGGTVNDAEVGDLDGDGDMDIFVGLKTGGYQVLKNNGSGSFSVASTPASGSTPLAVTLADLNHDGDLDVVSYEEDNGRILTNDGSGTFTSTSTFGTVYGGLARSGDVTGDGYNDVMVNNLTGSNSGVVLFRNDGSGGLGTQLQTFTGTDPYPYLFADVDGDGDLDGLGSTLTLNNGTGTFTSAGLALQDPTFLYNGNPVDGSPIAAGDVDGDGDMDLAVSFYAMDWGTYTYRSQVRIFINDSAPPTNTDGTLVAAGGVSEPVALASTINTVGEAINVFDFSLADGGGSDGVALGVSQLVVHTSGTGDFSKITWRLNGPDAGNVTGVYSSGTNTITFSGLGISVASGGSETYTVNAYFNNTSGLSQGQTYILSIDGDTDVTVASGSTRMASGQTAITNGSGTVVNVNAAPSVSNTPTDITVTEDSASNVNLSALSFADADNDALTVTLSLSAGTFSAPADGAGVGSGVTETQVNGQTITLAGSAADINTYLDTLSNIKYTGTANASGNNIATLTISAQDSQGNNLTSNPVVNIDITNVNDTPTNISLSNTSISENSSTASALTIGSLSSTDPDSGDTFTYSIAGGADQANFQVTGSSLQFQAGTVLNYEAQSSYSVTVRTTDAGGLSYDKNLTITLTDVNEAPTVANAIADQNVSVSQTFNFQFAANAFADVDAGQTLTYAATQGDGSPLPGWLSFNAGTRTFSGTPGGGDTGTVTLKVTATDNGSGNLSVFDTFDVVVTNGPTVSTASASYTDTAANDSFGNVTGSISATANSGSITGYGIFGGTSGSTLIDAASYDIFQTGSYGTLYVNSSSGAYVYVPTDNAALNGPSAPVTDVFTLEATDSGGTASNTLTITINGANDTPELAAPSSSSYTDTSANDSFSNTAGTLNGSDRDTGATLSYGISSGTTGGTTNIGGTVYNISKAGSYGTLYVKSDSGAYVYVPSASAINAIATGLTPADSFDVTLSDGSLTSTQTFTINFTGANDLPGATGVPASITVEEDVVSNVDLSSITLTDPDIGDSLTLTISTGAGILSATSSGSVTVSGSGTSALTLTGTAADIDGFINTASQVQYTGASNINGNNAATLTLAANDGSGNTSLGTIAIDISPMADTPSVTGTTVPAGTQSTTGLVLSRNPADGAETTHFKITGISNGTLYKNDGTTQINNGDFITFAEGNAGLKFTSSGASDGSFTAQASSSAIDAGLGGASVVATIDVVMPAITSTSYNARTGVLTVSGENFPSLTGASNDIIASKFTITGEGGTTYTLTDTANVEIISASSFSLSLSATDKAAINALLNKSGTSSTDNTLYNLTADDDWAAGAAVAIDIADSSNGINVTLNSAPSITSNAGGSTASVNVAENSVLVTTVAGADADSDALTYSISGGSDQGKFSINASTGTLTFISPPNYESPADSDNNNTYEVIVNANDGHGGNDTQTITVSVTDVNENTGGGTGGVTDPTVPTGTYDGVVITGTTETTSDGTTITTISVPVVTNDRDDDPDTEYQTHADIPLATDSTGDTLIEVSIPTGVGLTAQTLTGNAQTLRDILISASESRIEDAQSFAEILQQGIDTYVGTVADQDQVSVRTVTLSAAGNSSPGLPIIITGAEGAGENSTTNPLRQEALVIDASNLPAGSVLQLNNVEFAIIIGASHVVGGDGRNFVVGDSANQYIVLGAEDDVLRGGGGADTVGSRSGDDQLHGDEGNDFLVGGSDDDTLYGDEGNDILQGGGSDAGSWTYALDSQGLMHARYVAQDSDLAIIASANITGQWSKPAEERGQVDERFAIIEQDYDLLADFALIYHAVTGDRPEAALLAAAVQGMTTDHLAQIAYDYFAAQNGIQGQALEVQMHTLIEQVWGNAPDEVVQIGVDYINNGGNWVHALKVLSLHENSRELLKDADGNLQLAQTQTLKELGLVPDSGDDQLFGGAGNDLLIGGGGNNLLNGGSGIDMAAFFGTISNYQIGLKENGSDSIDMVIRNVNSGEESILQDVELFRFGNSIYQKSDQADLTVGEFESAADILQLVGSTDLQAMGVPASWL